MFDSFDLMRVASYTPSHIGQRQLKELGVDLALAGNKDLAPDIWQELFDVAFDSELRAIVLSNPPTLEKASLILQESDPTLIDKALNLWSGYMDESLARKITSTPNFDHLQAFSFLLSGAVPTAVAREIWDRYGSELSEDELAGDCFDVLTEVITNYKILSDVELLELVFSETKKWETIALVLAQTIDFYPSVIQLVKNYPKTAYLNSGSKLAYFYSTVASSQHLTSEVAREILKMIITEFNSTSPKPRGWASTAAATIYTIARHPGLPRELRVYALELLVDDSKPQGQRSIPTKNLSKPVNSEADLAKQRELLALGVPHVSTPWSELTGEGALEVKEFIDMQGDWIYPTLSGNPEILTDFTDWGVRLPIKTIRQEITPALDASGPDAWKVFVNLLSGWESSLQDLLFTATSTAKL